MRYFELIFFLIAAGLAVFFMRRAEKGKVPEMRRFAAIDGLDEGVGRALEMGTTVVVESGTHAMGGFRGSEAPATLAGLAVLGHIATLCGKYGVELRYFTGYPYMVPLLEDIVKTGYTAGGRPEMYNPNLVTYAGGGTYEAYVDYIWQNRPATVIMIGPIWLAAMRVFGASSMAGSMNIGGDTRFMYQAFLIALCDYALLGEEVFAAATAVRKSPDMLGITRGQDLVKAILLAFLVFSFITALAGQAIIQNLIML